MSYREPRYKPPMIPGELRYYASKELLDNLSVNYKEEIEYITRLKKAITGIITAEKAKFAKEFTGDNRKVGWYRRLDLIEQDVIYKGLFRSLSEHLRIAQNLLSSTSLISSILDGDANPNIDLNVDAARQYPIQDILGSGYKLTQKGNKMWCSCPFHNEKTASFCIYLETNSFYCFGACGIGGDAIDFYKRLHQVSFRDAVLNLT